MTSDQRKTLEALADLSVRAEETDDGLMGPGYHANNAAAIRAALAEVDALTQQVATLTEERDHARAKWDGYETERERECVELRAQVADLEARAIPKAWVDSLDNRTLWVSLESPGDGTRDVCVRYHGGVATIERVVGTDRMSLETRMPLSAALSAAKEAL